MYTMTEEQKAERAKQKLLHHRVRTMDQYYSRYRNLAWGFVRGLKYRRIERSHHLQVLAGATYAWSYTYVKLDGVWYYEHNMPSAAHLHRTLQAFMPLLALSEVEAWLQDRTGAIPVPAPRPKKPYVPAGASAAE